MATAKEACLAETDRRVSLYDDEPEGSVSYGSWRDDKEGEWYRPEYLSGSYYSGGFVCLSNYETFLEEFPDAVNDGWALETPGGHQTYGLLLHVEKTPDEAWEMIARLSDYPSLNDEHLSELESEAADQEWEAWYCSEWRKLCGEKFAAEDEDPDQISDLEIDWRAHFEKAREAANVYWEAQGDEQSMYVNLKRALEKAEDPGKFQPE